MKIEDTWVQCLHRRTLHTWRYELRKIKKWPVRVWVERMVWFDFISTNRRIPARERAGYARRIGIPRKNVTTAAIVKGLVTVGYPPKLAAKRVRPVPGGFTAEAPPHQGGRFRRPPSPP